MSLLNLTELRVRVEQMMAEVDGKVRTGNRSEESTRFGFLLKSVLRLVNELVDEYAQKDERDVLDESLKVKSVFDVLNGLFEFVVEDQSSDVYQALGGVLSQLKYYITCVKSWSDAKGSGAPEESIQLYRPSDAIISGVIQIVEGVTEMVRNQSLLDVD